MERDLSRLVPLVAARPGETLATLHAQALAYVRSAPIVAAAARGPGARALRSGAELRRASMHALERLAAHPELLGGADLREVRSSIEAALAAAGARPLYTRDGIEGIGDLLADPVLAELRTQHTGNPRAVEVLDQVARHFSRRPVTSDRAPRELAIAFARDASLRDDLAALERQGARVYYQRNLLTPPRVREAISRVAILSQHNYTTTWLPTLLATRGRWRPNLGISESGRERAIDLGIAHASTIDERELAHDLDRILATLDGSIRFAIEGAAVPDAAHAVEARLNRAIEDVRIEHARRRMIQDNAVERTSRAAKILKQIVWIGLAAHAAEQVLPGLAAPIAGQADDVTSEVAELYALHDSGWDWKQDLKPRLRVTAPVLVGAAGIASQVPHLISAGHPLVAGALFGVTAVALSVTTALQSVAMYARAYDDLVREGKIPGHIAALAGDSEFQRTLAQLRATERLLSQGRSDELLRRVDERLQQLERAGALSAGQRAAVHAELAQLDLPALWQRVRAPGHLERLKAALVQDFSAPSRGGLALGAALSPIASALGILGGVGDNGFALAALGTVESVGASGFLAAAPWLHEQRYQFWLRRTLRRAERTRRAAVRK
jgi:hypothetical protein